MLLGRAPYHMYMTINKKTYPGENPQQERTSLHGNHVISQVRKSCNQKLWNDPPTSTSTTTPQRVVPWVGTISMTRMKGGEERPSHGRWVPGGGEPSAEAPGAASADRAAASSACRPCLPSLLLLNNNKDLSGLTKTRTQPGSGRRRVPTNQSTARAPKQLGFSKPIWTHLLQPRRWRRQGKALAAAAAGCSP